MSKSKIQPAWNFCVKIWQLISLDANQLEKEIVEILIYKLIENSNCTTAAALKRKSGRAAFSFLTSEHYVGGSAARIFRSRLSQCAQMRASLENRHRFTRITAEVRSASVLNVSLSNGRRVRLPLDILVLPAPQSVCPPFSRASP